MAVWHTVMCGSFSPAGMMHRPNRKAPGNQLDCNQTGRAYYLVLATHLHDELGPDRRRKAEEDIHVHRMRRQVPPRVRV